jgi:hypothetical protein
LNKLAILSAASLKYCGDVGEVIPGLRKWAFFCVIAAAVAVIGCGGGGSKSASTSTTTTGTSSGTTGSTRAPSATVNLASTDGLVYATFLSGAGRAVGDLYLNVENIILNDSYDGIFINRPQTTPITIHLTSYNLQMATLDVPLAGVNSELFDSATVVPYSFGLEQSNGSVALNPGDPGYLNVLQGNEPSVNSVSGPTQALYSATNITPSTRLRVFPGRDSVLPIFVDQTMFGIDGSGQNVGLIPDPTQPFSSTGIGPTVFSYVNEPTNTADATISGKIAGFLSDMVQLDLSHVPKSDIPTLKVSGLPATHFYLTGDRYAMSDDKSGASSGNFEELTLDPTTPIDGKMGQPNTIISTQFQFGNLPGTYDLTASNPTDLTGLSRITSLFGRWRALTDLANLNSTSFDIIVFPNSNESYTYASPADVIAIAHTGTQITNLYIGSVYYTGGSSKSPAVAQLFPLPAFVQGSVSGEVDYNLSNFTQAGGGYTLNPPSIRNGTYTSAGGALPAGFSSTGTFLVFR